MEDAQNTNIPKETSSATSQSRSAGKTRLVRKVCNKGKKEEEKFEVDSEK